MTLSVEAIVGIVGVMIAIPSTIYVVGQVVACSLTEAPEEGVSKLRLNTGTKHCTHLHTAHDVEVFGTREGGPTAVNLETD